MTKYAKSGALLVCQALLFYLFPLFAAPTDAMGMVFLMILGTFALSFLTGLLPCRWMKCAYPPITAAMFVPSVCLYYNESAFVHALWYLIAASVGVGLGALIRIQAVR